MANVKNSKILINGATGYVGAHCVKQALLDGYKVRAAVRSVKNEQKLKPLKDLAHASERLEFVEADLLKPDTWESAVIGCDYVFHVASPLPLNWGDETIIETAVKGTLNVLTACADCPTIKKVVITGAGASVSWGNDSTKTFNEEDWADLNVSPAYVKSKVLAERQAWSFVENFSAGKNNFALTVLLPCFILGPTLTNEEASSVTTIKRLLTHDVPGVPKIQFPIIDVRDVGKANLLAITNRSSDGQRILLSSKSLWFREMAKVVENEFHKFGYCVPTREIPYPILYIYSFFDGQVKEFLPLVGHEQKLDNSKAKQILEMDFIQPEKSLIDMGHSLISRGIVPAKRDYKPAIDQTRL
uniref:NAD-dependent epimerase/dehydratase domain-containing protein n=1 Tax=Acrobeloides nanus TaxID=290746 RepID=A0A914D8C6_9BILA